MRFPRTRKALRYQLSISWAARTARKLCRCKVPGTEIAARFDDQWEWGDRQDADAILIDWEEEMVWMGYTADSIEDAIYDTYYMDAR
jgi:hypothetical protein